MKKILLVGCGHMGSALLSAWVNIHSFKISIIDPLKYLKLKKNIQKKLQFINL